MVTNIKEGWGKMWKERERHEREIFTSGNKYETLLLKWFCQNLKPVSDQTSQSTSQFIQKKKPSRFFTTEPPGKPKVTERSMLINMEI